MAPKQIETVDAFMARLDHPRKDEIERLRRGILACDPSITEHVKWNAPSFRNASDDDRITFSLQPGDRLDLILHRGTRRREDVADFAFEDPSGRIRWIVRDRGVVSFAAGDDLVVRWDETMDLMSRWMVATLD